MTLYTRRGDAGLTDLANGHRVPKDDTRVEAYGTLDELTAALGVARSLCQATSGGDDTPRAALGERLFVIQRQLAFLSGYLATPGADFAQTRLGEEALIELEADIDKAEVLTGPLRAFVMPGANTLEAALHLARTVCRRAERRVQSLSREDAIDPAAIAYLNRLSDWLFAQARAALQTP